MKENFFFNIGGASFALLVFLLFCLSCKKEEEDAGNKDVVVANVQHTYGTVKVYGANGEIVEKKLHMKMLTSYDEEGRALSNFEAGKDKFVSGDQVFLYLPYKPHVVGGTMDKGYFTTIKFDGKQWTCVGRPLLTNDSLAQTETRRKAYYAPGYSVQDDGSSFKYSNVGDVICNEYIGAIKNAFTWEGDTMVVDFIGDDNDVSRSARLRVNVVKGAADTTPMQGVTVKVKINTKKKFRNNGWWDTNIPEIAGQTEYYGEGEYSATTNAKGNAFFYMNWSNNITEGDLEVICGNRKKTVSYNNGSSYTNYSYVVGMIGSN